MPVLEAVHIRPAADADRDWMRKEIRKWWSSEVVVVRGEKHYPAEMDGFIAERDNARIGLITLRIIGKSGEIMSLTTTGELPGLGEKLINTVISDLRSKNITRLKVVTTNDNISALRFYQQFGFEIIDWRKNALEKSRKIKPEIPLVGNFNIPIRDEIELEMTL